MADPTLQTFCCHHTNRTDRAIAIMQEFNTDAYNTVCMLSSTMGMIGAIYQVNSYGIYPRTGRAFSSPVRSFLINLQLTYRMRIDLRYILSWLELIAKKYYLEIGTSLSWCDCWSVLVALFTPCLFPLPPTCIHLSCLHIRSVRKSAAKRNRYKYMLIYIIWIKYEIILHIYFFKCFIYIYCI